MHPQFWPEDLEYAGKRVVIIGSGATAVTLVPAMAGTAAHVTMLQRSPTWIGSVPRHGQGRRPAPRLLPPQLAHRVIRTKNIALHARALQLLPALPRPGAQGRCSG